MPSLLPKKFPAPVGTTPLLRTARSNIDLCNGRLTTHTAAPMAPFFIAGMSPKRVHQIPVL